MRFEVDLTEREIQFFIEAVEIAGGRFATKGFGPPKLYAALEEYLSFLVHQNWDSIVDRDFTDFVIAKILPHAIEARYVVQE